MINSVEAGFFLQGTGTGLKHLEWAESGILI
jgi:hypothetical protein